MQINEKSIIQNKNEIQKNKKNMFKSLTIASTMGIALISATTTAIILNKTNHYEKGLIPQLNYRPLTTEEFNLLTTNYQYIKNSAIKSIMTKQNIIYISNDLFNKIKDKEQYLSQSDLTEIKNKILNSVEGNFRISSLMTGTRFSDESFILNKTGKNWFYDQRENYLQSPDLTLKYKNSEYELPIKCKFKPAKTAEYNLIPINHFTNETIRTIFKKAELKSVRNDLDNLSGGYFMGLDYIGEKKADENGAIKSWNGNQKISVQDFINKTYDWFLTCFKRVNLIPTDFRNDLRDLFEYHGTEFIRNGSDENYWEMSESRFNGPRSIVSKIDIRWKSLESPATSPTYVFSGSYLNNDYWGNY